LPDSGHPADRASCPSRFWLLWLWPLLLRGAAGPLTEDDIFPLPQHLTCASLDQQWFPQWRRLGKLQIVAVFRSAYGWRYGLVVVVFSVWLTSLAMVPILVDGLFLWLANGHATLDGLLWCVGLIACYLINCNAGSQWYQQTTQLGYELRASTALIVFRRVLVLPVGAPSAISAINAVQVDAERLFTFAQLNHLIYVAVVVTAIMSGHMVRYTDWIVALAALTSIVASLGLQLLMLRKAAPARARMLKHADARCAALRETLSAIKVLKMYGWDCAMQTRVEQYREMEVQAASTYLRLRALSSAMLFCAPLFSITTVMLVWTAQGMQATVDTVFLVYTVLNMARAPLGGVAMGVSAVVDGANAARRIQTVAQPTGDVPAIFHKDLREAAEPFREVSAVPGEPVIALVGDFGFDCSDFVLRADLQLQMGDFVAVTGPVGAGKSSVLLAMLGEMKSAGVVPTNCNLAYLPQQPWLRQGTVRAAIVQDLPWDSEAYAVAVGAAQLSPDLEKLPEADRTRVGASGCSLSGGQRTRLGLAHVVYRCCVSRVDLVLLDDIFAAVDAKVANLIAQDAVHGLLVRPDRCVVMVMNANLTCVSQATVEIVVSDGEATVSRSRRGLPAPSLEAFRVPQPVDAASISQQAPASGQMFAEEVDFGKLAISVLGFYLGAGDVRQGLFILPGVIFLAFTVEGCRIAADSIMGSWGDAANSHGFERQDWLHTYLLLVVAVVATVVLRGEVVMWLACRASKRIHARMLDSLLQAPLHYFDRTPPGRILGIFSKDLDALDALLPQYGLDCAQDMTLLLGVIVVCVWATPVAAAVLVPVVAGFWKIRGFFSKTSRETKRMDATSRAFVYTAVTEALDGLPCIRAHKQETDLLRHFADAVERNGKAFFQTYILQPWCILVLDSLSAVIVAVTTVLCVLLRETLSLSVANLAISYSLLTRGKVHFTVRLSIETENQLIAAERLKSFLARIPVERCSGKRQKAWPLHGAIVFRDVAMRYHPDLPLVLRGLSLQIQAGSKFAVVGRTGSGKSSMLACLLRLVAIETGTIEVDGIDISRVPVRDLRRAIAVVPQDPHLWSGSVASNLDPLGEVAMSDLSAALVKVGMSSFVESLGGLRGAVELSSWSSGQRQLLCIARAVARDSMVVVLDEATSTVDHATDTAMQSVLRTVFAGRTMLVVAHRLQTVADADLIAVMASGVLDRQGLPSDIIASLQADAGLCQNE